MPARRALVLLIAVSTALRLLWAAAVEPGNDEAYHHLYTVHPALSYFDHPPLMMWVERVGLFLCGDAVNHLTIRVGFILLFAGSTWVLFRWTARWYGAWAGFYAALALNLTAYFSAAAGAFVLPDGPLLFFTLLTCWALSEALVAKPGRIWPWVAVGLAWAGAMLSKYHGILLPAGALLYVFTTPGGWRILKTPGPYLAVLIGIVGFTPVLVWNYEHDWASFAYQGSRGVGWAFRPVGLLKMLGGQFAYLLPWMWADLVLVVVALGRLNRGRAGVDWLAFCLAAVPLAFFLLVSSFRDSFPHWSLVGFLPLYPALGAKWARHMEASPTWMRRRIAIGAAALLMLLGLWAAQARFGLIPLKAEPTMEMSGWPSVAQELDRRGLLDRSDTFLFTSRWYTSGQLQYAVGDRAAVLCYNKGEPHAFADWSRPKDWVGKDGILVSFDESGREPENFEEFFQRIEPLGEFEMTRGGKPFRRVWLYRCVGEVKGFVYGRK
jgi:4-amino-4-deoxy-L-arabinose transferase-like glycosyltransferase